MRYVFHFLFLANMILCGMMPLLLPQRIAIHFGLDGTANGWARVTEGMLTMGGIVVFLYVILWGTIWLVKLGPASLINLPMNEKYWKSEENVPKMRQLMEKLLWDFYAFMLSFFFACNVTLVFANLQNPPMASPKIFFVLFVAFGLYFTWWFIRCCLAFRLPKNGDEN